MAHFVRTRTYLKNSLFCYHSLADRDYFVDAFILQTLITWILQKQHWFEAKSRYCQESLAQLGQPPLATRFLGYYDWLAALWQALARPRAQDVSSDPLFARLPCFGPTLFWLSEAELRQFSLPDDCLYQPAQASGLGFSSAGKFQAPLPLFNLLEWCDEHTLLTESGLGLVMENLLEPGLRRQSGSYYTSPEIARRITRDALASWLAQRLAWAESWFVSLTSPAPESLAPERLRELVMVLEQVTILDPAAGAGNFLISAVAILDTIFQSIAAQWRGHGRDWAELPRPAGAELSPSGADLSAASWRQAWLWHWIVPRSIYGVELNHLAAKVARARLLLFLLNRSDPALLPMNGDGISLVPRIREGDALCGYLADLPHNEIPVDDIDEAYWQTYPAASAGRAELQPFHWPIAFPEVFRERGGFDLVIGNPPYLMEVRRVKAIFQRYRLIPLGQQYYEPKMDLFYFFMERGIDLLAPDGILGYVVPEYWLTRTFAHKLRRKVFAETTPRKLVFFRQYSIFEAAQGQHTMLIFLQKRQMRPHDLTSLVEMGVTIKPGDDSSMARSSELVEMSRSECVTLALYQPDHDTVAIRAGLATKIWSSIQAGSGQLLSAEICQGLITPQHCLARRDADHVSEMADIPSGAGIFVLSAEEVRRVEWTLAEIRLLKPFHFARDIEPFRYQAEPGHQLWYIPPAQAKLISTSPGEYPNLIRHFNRFQAMITSDHKPYGLHRARQPEWFESPGRILGVRKTMTPRFALISEPYYVDQSVLIIRPMLRRISPFYLTALLNSRLAGWIFWQIKRQGQQLQIDKGVLLQFPIRQPAPVDEELVAELARLYSWGNQYAMKTPAVSTRWESLRSDTSQLLDALIAEIYFGSSLPGGGLARISLPMADFQINTRPNSPGPSEYFQAIWQLCDHYRRDAALQAWLRQVRAHEWIREISRWPR